MKAPLLLTVLLTCFGLHTIAQCIPAIPSTAVVVDSVGEIDGGFDPIWVCSSATFNSDGGFHNIYLEPGAEMTTSGGIDTIYVSDGASFFMNGGIHVIYFINPSDVSISGGIATQNPCTSITFDYSNAPENGCTVTPLASFQSSDSSICIGGCINFSNLSANATSWQWSFPGANPSTSTEENPLNICYDTIGSFEVTLIVTNGTISDTLTLSNFITVHQPIIPVLTQNDDSLFSSQGFTIYQWYYDNTAISGATDHFYVATQGGLYSIVVIDSNGCEASAEIKIAVTGIEDVDETHLITVYPNPAGSSIMILYDRQEILQFFDPIGKNIFSIQTSSSGKTQVDISTFPAVFFVRAEAGGWRKVIRY